MRYALILLWLIGFTCLMNVQAKAPPKSAVAVTQDRGGTHFTVVGPYQTTREDAWQAALERARVEVVEQLQSDGVLYQPDAAYIRTRLVRGSREEERDMEPPVGKVRRLILDISITPQHQTEIAQREQQRLVEVQQQEKVVRVRERMSMAAIILAGLVAVLGAIASYLRLDELTKGYYTGWLLAGVGLVSAVAVAGVALLLLA